MSRRSRPSRFARPALRTANRSAAAARVVSFVLLGAMLAVGAAPAAEPPFHRPLDWPEAERAFIQDGPGFLLTQETLDALVAADSTTRSEAITELLSDPIPDTAENELVDGIARRRALVLQELRTFQDVRSRLLFLHGAPDQRTLIDCAETFRPMEIWTYRGQRPLIVYRPSTDTPWTLWLPTDSKRVLYDDEMEYYLEQWEELGDRIQANRRIDRFFCGASRDVDELTGVDGLFGFQEGRPRDEDFLRALQPPADLAAWSRAALRTPVEPGEPLPAMSLEVFYPERVGQRLKALLKLRLDDPRQLEPIDLGNDKRELRLLLEGQIERENALFETFRVRYQIPLVEGALVDVLEQPLVLLAERLLRPDEDFLLRLMIREEATDRVLHLTEGLRVPNQSTPMPELAMDEHTVQAIEERLATETFAGVNSLLLVPPATDIVFGLWRAEALVTGERIVKVAFKVDGKTQLTRKRRPFTAELRLQTQPKEQTVTVEGYDAEGELVASDEVVVNQTRGELRVTVVEPARGARAVGPTQVEAEIVVPEERSVAFVEIRHNEDVVARLESPPWRASIDVPAGGELTYITVVAELDDGLRAEDVRFVNAPEYLEQVDVNLVELFTTVVDRRGRPVLGLERDIFSVAEDGRPQELVKFELVEDLPLSLGIAIDTSGSMVESLGVARRTATDFLDKIIGPRDRTFALAFADRPELIMSRTSDVGAVSASLEGLVADGRTSLHDAIVTSLHYYKGIRGRRALVLLSDGEDTSSSLGFDEALEVAKRSGVTIYAIGLRISRADFGVRRKLDRLAEETGGRTLFINEAAELADAYAQIERELRSQYLLAYASDQGSKDPDRFREIEVEVDGRGLEARTLRGYYP